MTDPRTSVAERLPTFVIIGAMRCGTTSVHNWLAQHPSISMSKKKELSFFVTGKHGNHAKGVEWYASQFDATKPVRGESSPKYSKDPIFPGVPERIHAFIPDARLIYLVRDPIERLLSHYHVIALQGWERRNLAEALGDLSPSNKYLAPGLYAHQLERYRAVFPADQIRVATLEDLQRDPKAAMGRILDFLDLPAADAATLDLSAHNRSAPKRAVTLNGRRLQRRLGRRSLHLAGRIPGLRTVVYRPMSRPTLDPALRARLEAFYAADQAALRELLA